MLYAAPLPERWHPDFVRVALTKSSHIDRVVDLGLRLCDEGVHELVSRELTEETARYISPERACGLTCDVRSDLYSIGCLLFEAAEGRPPFVGKFNDVVLNHVMVKPPALRRVPRQVSLIIERLLAKEPADRYQSVDELRQSLEALRVMTSAPNERAHNLAA